jgi:hypothetical protein
MVSLNKGWLLGLGLAVIAVMLVAPEAAMAQVSGGIGAAGTRLQSEAKPFGNLANIILTVIGFVMLGAGVIKVIKDKEARQPIGPGVGLSIAGFLLLSIIGFANMGSQSIFGSDASTGLNTIGVE